MLITEYENIKYLKRANSFLYHISHMRHGGHNFSQLSQKSQNGQDQEGPLGPSSPAPSQAGIPTAGCPGIPGGFWRSPRRRFFFLSGQPVPALSVSKYIIYSKINKCFLMFQIETPMFQFVPIASHPISGHTWKELGSPCIFMHKDEFPPETSAGWTGPALSLSSHVRYSRSLIIFVALS